VKHKIKIYSKGIGWENVSHIRFSQVRFRQRFLADTPSGSTNDKLLDFFLLPGVLEFEICLTVLDTSRIKVAQR